MFALYTDIVGEVVSGAAQSQQTLSDIHDSIQTLPSAEDDTTLLRVHDNCEEAIARLGAVRERAAELENQLVLAEERVSADNSLICHITETKSLTGDLVLDIVGNHDAEVFFSL